VNARGFSLVELLVALTISGVLIAGAVTVYSQSRRTHDVSESYARVQEEARYALGIIEPDVQLAGYYGFTNAFDDFQLVDSTGSGIPTTRMEQTDAAVAAVPASAQACGNNFAVDLMQTVQGSNDVFALGPGWGGACAPFGAGAQPGTDTLTIRRASTEAVAASDQFIQLAINRLQPNNQRIVLDGVVPAMPDPDLRSVRNLIVRTFYISQDSEERGVGVPSLRMISLGAGQAFTDTEIMPGVEDLQVQFGVDTGDYDGDNIIDDDGDGNGIPDSPNGRATRYVDADDAVLPGAQVVSVRIWLRLRAEQPEMGFIDDRRYQYAGVDYTPAGADQPFRRVLVTRTIQLRNARTL
jgi:type IV pilus assembly protein PilW